MKWVILAACLAAAPSIGIASPSSAPLSISTTMRSGVVSMRRARELPRIDGELGDSAWLHATKLPAFAVRSPKHGAAPREATDVFLLYRPDALYIAIRCYDSAPQKVVAALGPRDAPPNSDRITLYLDPLLTKYRGYYFGVSAAGIQFDGLFYGDQNDVPTWDAPWQSATRRDDKGWSAELRIPLTSLGYQDRSVQRWGFYIERYLQRHQEQSGWPLLPRFGGAFAERFGALDGLEKMKRGERLRIQPYSAAKIQLDYPVGAPRENARFAPNAGLDLRYSTPGATRLVLSINPDFGEVEQDPIVLNVTPNPVYFSENRPYFVAGTDLFQTARATTICSDMFCFEPATMLYTRRIGAPGASPTMATDGQIVERDPFPRIVGALKVLGEAGPSFSYAALAALVAPSFVTEARTTGERMEHEVSPWTQYTALRGRLRLGSRSYLGVIGTGTSRFGDVDGYAAAVDALARSAGGWELTGMLSASHSRVGDGLGGFLRGGKLGFSRWQAWAEAALYSRDFHLDDLGFLTRTDFFATQVHALWNLLQPKSIFRDATIEIFALDARSLSDPELTLERYLQLDARATFRNQLVARFFLRFYDGHKDDLEMRGGPPLPRARALRFYWELGSDASRALSAKLYGPIVYRDAGLTWAINGEATLRLWRRLSLQGKATYFALRGYRSYVDTLDGANEPTYIAGDLSLDQLELRISATVGLHRLFSLRFFAQLLYGVGRYEAAYHVTANGAGESALLPVNYDGASDFTSLDVIGYAALRWELGAGTAALLVYKMASALGDSGSHARFRFGSDLSSLFSRAQDHQLLLKISHAWGV